MGSVGDVTVLAGCYPGEDCSSQPPGLDAWFVALVLAAAVVLVVGVVVAAVRARRRSVRRRDEERELSSTGAPTS